MLSQYMDRTGLRIVLPASADDLCRRGPSLRDLPRARFRSHLRDQFKDLRQTGRCRRMTARQQTATRIDRSSPFKPGRAAVQQRAALARFARFGCRKKRSEHTSAAAAPSLFGQHE